MNTMRTRSGSTLAAIVAGALTALAALSAFAQGAAPAAPATGGLCLRVMTDDGAPLAAAPTVMFSPAPAAGATAPVCAVGEFGYGGLAAAVIQMEVSAAGYSPWTGTVTITAGGAVPGRITLASALLAETERAAGERFDLEVVNLQGRIAQIDQWIVTRDRLAALRSDATIDSGTAFTSGGTPDSDVLDATPSDADKDAILVPLDNPRQSAGGGIMALYSAVHAEYPTVEADPVPAGAADPAKAEIDNVLLALAGLEDALDTAEGNLRSFLDLDADGDNNPSTPTPLNLADAAAVSDAIVAARAEFVRADAAVRAAGDQVWRARQNARARNAALADLALAGQRSKSLGQMAVTWPLPTDLALGLRARFEDAGRPPSGSGPTAVAAVAPSTTLGAIINADALGLTVQPDGDPAPAPIRVLYADLCVPPPAGAPAGTACTPSNRFTLLVNRESGGTDSEVLVKARAFGFGGGNPDLTVAGGGAEALFCPWGQGFCIGLGGGGMNTATEFPDALASKGEIAEGFALAVVETNLGSDTVYFVGTGRGLLVRGKGGATLTGGIGLNLGGFEATATGGYLHVVDGAPAGERWKGVPLPNRDTRAGVGMLTLGGVF